MKMRRSKELFSEKWGDGRRKEKEYYIYWDDNDDDEIALYFFYMHVINTSKKNPK
jgi:hypothetical protein